MGIMLSNRLFFENFFFPAFTRIGINTGSYNYEIYALMYVVTWGRPATLNSVGNMLCCRHVLLHMNIVINGLSCSFYWPRTSCFDAITFLK